MSTPAAAAPAWEQMEQAITAALDRDASLMWTTVSPAWDAELLRLLGDDNEKMNAMDPQSRWSMQVYRYRRFPREAGGFFSLFFQTYRDVNEDRGAYMMARLTHDELWTMCTHIREAGLDRRQDWYGELARRFLAEQRRLATPAELATFAESERWSHSNVDATLLTRMSALHLNHIRSFGPGPMERQPRPLHLLQRMKNHIDLFRRNITGVELARQIILELIIHLVSNRRLQDDPVTWNGVIAYLTIPELTAIQRELPPLRAYRRSCDSSDSDDDDEEEKSNWIPQWVRPERFRHFAVSFGEAYEEIRAQRATLAASLLIQRLAHKRGGGKDLGTLLASFVTRTVDPKKPHTHIDTIPDEWERLAAARLRKQKRKDAEENSAAAMQTGQAAAANTRHRKK